MRVISDFPWYFFLLCLLAGAAYSAVLYWMGRRRSVFESRTLWVLTALRFVAVTVIACLLLAPLVKRAMNQHEKPIIVVAQDNSQSVVLCKDSAYYRGDYARAMERLVKELRKDYEVHCCTYGSTVTQGDDGEWQPSYNESSTDMAALVTDIAGRYENRNVGAVLLTGDGIFNQGLNPVSAAKELTYPVYAVALGDTATRRDAAIADIRYNRIAYMGNQFPMEVTVRATRLKGENKVLTVKHDGKTLFSKNIGYATDDYVTTEPLLLDAGEAGLQTYTVSIAPANDEVSVRNNTRSITVEVIDGHQKVAIVAAAPHPDVAALRQSLEQNQNYEVETFLANDFKEQLSRYDLVILHNLPCRNMVSTRLLTSLQEERVPAIFVLGNQTDLARFNTLHLGLEIYSQIDRQNESTPVFNGSFPLFTLNDDVRQTIERFPPLSSPFGDYKPSGNTQCLFTAKVGNVNSGMPLVAFAQRQETRYAFVAGEGLWRWRLADYATNQSHNAFNTLVNKMVVYTSMKVDKERFHIETKPIYRAGEPIGIEASLYNDNYELTNTPDVEIALQGDGQPSQSFAFNKTANAYSITLGSLPSGRYRYTATTTYRGEKLKATGNFMVEELQLEDLNLVADHALLNTLAASTGGEILMPQEMERLPEMLRQRDDIKTVIYSRTRYTELLNLPWILILIILMLGAEWAVRKYNGEL